MRMKHLLLECYCSCDTPNENDPCYMIDSSIGIHCLQCKKFSYTKCPHEIAYSNEDGVIENVDDFIGFGGEMDVDDKEERQKWITEWSNICRTKINVVYDEYMNKRNQVE